MFERILVPVDGSLHGKGAIAMAIDLAKCCGSEVYLLHVIRDWSLPKEILQMMSAGEITHSRQEILESSAEIILDTAEEQFRQAGITEVQGEFLLGDPASTILQYAGEKNVDLIVIGHRGLGPTQGLLGGVARKLVNMTSISCLIATQET